MQEIGLLDPMAIAASDAGGGGLDPGALRDHLEGGEPHDPKDQQDERQGLGRATRSSPDLRVGRREGRVRRQARDDT